LNPNRYKSHFNDLLDRIGVWVIYTNGDRRFRCTECFDRFTGDSRPDCGFCFGTGYKVSLERWLAFISNALFRGRAADVPHTAIGYDPNHTYFVFTRSKDIPARGDRFLVVEWNMRRNDVPIFGGQPTRLVHVLEVLYVENEIVGELIYNNANCLIRDDAIAQYEKVLLSAPIALTRL